MLSVRQINLRIYIPRSRVSYASWLARTIYTKMVDSCWAFGCANRFWSTKRTFLYGFPTFLRLEGSKGSCQWSAKAGPYWILRENMWRLLCIRKANCQKPQHNSRFLPRARLILRLLYINICSYPAMFYTFYRRKASEKERWYRLGTCTYRLILHKCSRHVEACWKKPVVSKAFGYWEDTDGICAKRALSVLDVRSQITCLRWKRVSKSMGC